MQDWKAVIRDLYSEYTKLQTKLDKLDEDVSEARRKGIITVDIYGKGLETAESNLAAAPELWQQLLDSENELNKLISEVEKQLNNVNKVVLRKVNNRIAYQIIKSNNPDQFENALKELLRLLNIRLASKLALLKWKMKGMSSEDFPSVSDTASDI